MVHIGLMVALGCALAIPESAVDRVAEQSDLCQAKQLRQRLAQSRQRQRMMPGDLGMELAPAQALAEVRAVIRKSQAGQIPVVIFLNPRAAQSYQLATKVCRGRPVIQVTSKGVFCSSDEENIGNLTQRARVTHEIPWKRGRKTFRITAHHTGNVGVEYFFEGVTPQTLTVFLDEVLVLGSPFVYAKEGQRFETWRRKFAEDFESQLPGVCQFDQATRRWLGDFAFIDSLWRRHSYMTPGEYMREQKWLGEVDEVAQYLTLPMTGRPTFAETVYCLAYSFQGRPWALFNSALLIDIQVYEAQAARRDPRSVLTSQALRIRQVLFNKAFSEVLSGYFYTLPQPAKTDLVPELLAAQLGNELPAVHDILLWLENLPEESAVRQSVAQAGRLLEPRRADQPVLAQFAIDQASPGLTLEAQRMFSVLHSVNGGAEGMSTLFADQGLQPNTAFLLLGGYGANRFYALYDLSRGLVDSGLFADAGQLFFWGAVLHFLLQYKDIQSMELKGRLFSVPEKDQSALGWPLLKTYHFWTEALLGCQLQPEIGSVDVAERTGRRIGTHYRTMMTPLYLVYQVFHRGSLEYIFEDNRSAIDLHAKGSAFGYRLCEQGTWQ